MESIAKKTAAGALWSAFDKFGNMALQFVVNLVLARLLSPTDFGIIGMLAIFIAVSQVLVDSGFGSALIQKLNPTQTDYSTIFYWNLLLSIIFYGILFISSKWVAHFFHMPLLDRVLRIIGINLVISAVYTIQTTKLRKQLAFRTLSISNLGAYMIGALVGISMAYYNCGVWSLVALQIMYNISGVIILWIITRWHPSLKFSKRTLKELFGFGGYIMGASILENISRNIQGLVIGRKFSAAQMGYFSQAKKFDLVTSNTLPQVIGQVMYPTFSAFQNDPLKLKVVLSKSVRIISFLTFPLMAFLILVADSLIGFLYGYKWLPCVPYYQIFCMGGIFSCLININFYVVAALGYSKILFKWSFYKWSFLLLAILIGLNFGVTGIVWGIVFSNVNTYMVNVYLASRKLNQSIWSQISEWGYILIWVIIPFAVSIVMYKTFSLNLWLTAFLFLSMYVGLNFLMNKNILVEMVQIYKLLRNRTI